MAKRAAVRRGRKNSDVAAVSQTVSAQTGEVNTPKEEAPKKLSPKRHKQPVTVKSKTPEEVPPALKVPADTMRIPAYLLEQELSKKEAEKRRLQEEEAKRRREEEARIKEEEAREREEEARRKKEAEARAYRKQQEEEAREREAQQKRQKELEEEQKRLKREAKEKKKKAQAQKERARREAERKRREAEEKRINAEVERRVKAAEEEAGPKIIVSPKVARQKRLTILWMAAGVVALAMISIFIGVRYDRMRSELAAVSAGDPVVTSSVHGEVSETTGDVTLESSGASLTQADFSDGTRRVYLTFDDGPSAVTGEILDILKEYDVKATFFVLGREDEASRAIYRRIVEEGHTLAMHSYTHDMTDIYASLDNFQADLHRLQNLLYEETGVWCTVYRFPGGSSTTASRVDMQELIDYLGREHIIYYDWNVYGGDDISPDNIVSNVMRNVTRYSNAVVLMHDAADKEETVIALPQIIEYIEGLDRTILLPITDETIPVQHGSTS